MIDALGTVGNWTKVWASVSSANLIVAAIFMLLLIAALLIFRQRLSGIRAAHLRDLKQTNDMLHESQKLLCIQYDNSPDMMFSLDVDTQRVLRCNNALVSKLGYSKEELLVMAANDLYAPVCHQRAVLALRQSLASAQSNDIDLKARCKDGRVIDVSFSAVLYRDQEGKMLYSDITWRDVTQRKRADALASKRDKQLATLYLLGEQMLHNDTLPALMHTVAYSLFETISVRCVLIGDLCREGRGIIMQVAVGVPPQFFRSAEPHSIAPFSLPVTALAGGAPLHLSARSCPRWLEGIRCLSDVFPENGVATVLQDSHGAFGLLMVFHEAGNEFSQQDIDYIQALTNLLSVAADRSRLKDGLRSWQVTEADWRYK